MDEEKVKLLRNQIEELRRRMGTMKVPPIPEPDLTSTIMVEERNVVPFSF